jgi:chaperonin GroEL
MLRREGNQGFVRMALENAVSVVGVLLLSEATMTEPPEEPKPDHQRMEP